MIPLKTQGRNPCSWGSQTRCFSTGLSSVYHILLPAAHIDAQTGSGTPSSPVPGTALIKLGVITGPSRQMICSPDSEEEGARQYVTVTLPEVQGQICMQKLPSTQC